MRTQIKNSIPKLEASAVEHHLSLYVADTPLRAVTS